MTTINERIDLVDLIGATVSGDELDKLRRSAAQRGLQFLAKDLGTGYRLRALYSAGCTLWRGRRGTYAIPTDVPLNPAPNAADRAFHALTGRKPAGQPFF